MQRSPLLWIRVGVPLANLMDAFLQAMVAEGVSWRVFLSRETVRCFRFLFFRFATTLWAGGNRDEVPSARILRPTYSVSLLLAVSENGAVNAFRAITLYKTVFSVAPSSS